MHALGQWDCPNPLDCNLRNHCWLQDRFGSEACAPYYGPPNYQVPALVYQVNYYQYVVSIWERASRKVLSWDYSWWKQSRIFWKGGK